MSLADCIIKSPQTSRDEFQNKSAAYFNLAEITELSLGVALFHGFSKMLICLGREPKEMETTIIQTPTAPAVSLSKEFENGNPMHVILSPMPNLRDRWLDLENSLWKNCSYPTEKLRVLRYRLSELLSIPQTYSDYYETVDIDLESDRLADQFFYDVRSFTDGQRNKIVRDYGLTGLVDLMVCLALYDGAFRLISMLGYLENPFE